MEREYCPYCMHWSETEVCAACKKHVGAYQPAPHHLQPGTVLNGKYLIGAVLGEGGFGITYIGRDMTLDMRVAVKEYYPSGIANRSNTNSANITANIGASEEVFDKGKNRFLAEARALAKFASESSIVTVRDFFPENNTAYIVMDYLEGKDLKEYMVNRGVLSFSEAFSLLDPIMSGLGKIHASGLIHRDISPANIMILKDGGAKLLDFGAARNVGGNDEKSLSVMLKPGYAPEEQYRSKGHQGPWTDVYALSATMYKLVTGVTPDDAMNRLFRDELKRPSELNPGITAAQEDVILKGMSVRQEDRYQSICQLQEACVQSAKQSALRWDDEKAVMGGLTEDDELTYMPGRTPRINKVVEVEHTATDGVTSQKTTAQAKSVVSARMDPPVEVQDVSMSASSNKPNILGLLGSVFCGGLAFFLLLMTVAMAGNKSLGTDAFEPAQLIMVLIPAAVFGGLAFLFGRLYYPRINNRKQKPNKACFWIGIVCALLAVCFAIAGINLMQDNYQFGINHSDPSTGMTLICVALFFLGLTAFMGYFYYPRLHKKKSSVFYKVYGAIGAIIVIAIFASAFFTGTTTITFGDMNVKKDVTRIELTADILSDRDLENLKQLEQLEELVLTECFLDNSDLEIIGSLTQLKKLSLAENSAITDISPLGSLVNLVSLNIDSTNVKDISCVANMTKLEELNISNTAVKADTIKLPAGLRSLNCSNNGLSTLNFLTSVDNLQELDASFNDLSDISILSKFAVLTYVTLSSNKIEDLSPIACESLHGLYAADNAIKEISAISKCIYLNDLDLSGNQISDISPLSGMTKLYTLELAQNQIRDITPLQECFRLYKLELDHNQITDIAVIADLDELELFSIRGNQVSDISPLANSKKLCSGSQSFDLRDNCIQRIDALAYFKNITDVYLSGNQIADISPLANCTSLVVAYIDNNQIRDLAPLFKNGKMNLITAVGNPIESLDGMNMDATTALAVSWATLKISYNENIDWAQASKAPDVHITVYDATERQQAELRELGYNWFGDSSELEEESK